MQFKIYLSQGDRLLTCSDVSFSDDEHFFNPAVLELPYIEFEDNGSEIKLTYARMTIKREYLKGFNLLDRKFKVKVVAGSSTLFDGYAIRVGIDDIKVQFRLVDVKDYDLEMLSKEKNKEETEFYVPVLFGDVPYAELPMIDKDNLDFRLPINGTAKRCYSGSNEIDFSVDGNKATLWYSAFRGVRFALTDNQKQIYFENEDIFLQEHSTTETSVLLSVFYPTLTYKNLQVKIFDENNVSKSKWIDLDDWIVNITVDRLNKATEYSFKLGIRDKYYHGLSLLQGVITAKTDGKTDTEVLDEKIDNVDEKVDRLEDTLLAKIGNLDDELQKDVITRMSDNGSTVTLYNKNGGIVATLKSSDFNSSAWNDYKKLLKDVLEDGKITESEAKSLAKAYDKLDGKIDNKVGDVETKVTTVDGKISIVDNKVDNKVDKTTTATTVMTFKNGSTTVGKLTNYSSSGLGLLNETGVFLTSRLKQNSRGQVDWNTSGDSFVWAYNDYALLAYVKNSDIKCFVKCDKDENVYIKGKKLYWNGSELKGGGSTVHYGTSSPSRYTGKDGDIYVKY